MRMTTRLLTGAIAVLTTALFTGCGCDAVGYFGVELTLRDAVTNAAVPMVGSKLYAGKVPGIEPTQLLDSTMVPPGSTYSICCGGGRFYIVLDKAGYQRFNTTVNVPTKGRCDIPVLQRVVARLQPIA